MDVATTIVAPYSNMLLCRWLNLQVHFVLPGGQKTSEWPNKCLPPPWHPQPPFSWAKTFGQFHWDMIKEFGRRKEIGLASESTWVIGKVQNAWLSRSETAKNPMQGPERVCRFLWQRNVPATHHRVYSVIFCYRPSWKNVAVWLQRQMMPNLMCLMKGLVLPWDLDIDKTRY